MSELPSDFSPTPDPPRRRLKTSSPSPLRFFLGLLAFAASLLVPYFLYSIYGVAILTLHTIGNPHISHHHNITSDADLGELGVVKSYFDGGDEGVESWDLVASLYWRQERWIKLPGVEQPLEDILEQRDHVWAPWERLYSDVVIRGMDGREMVSSRAQPVHGTARVVIPSRVLPLLRRPFGYLSTQFVSSFHLLPADRPASHLLPLNSTKPTSQFTDPRSHGYNEPDHVRLPLPYPVAGVYNAQQHNPSEDEYYDKAYAEKDFGWEALLAKAPAIGSMLRPEFDPAPEDHPSNSIAKGTEPFARLGGDNRKNGQKAKLVSKSWVAMARDAPVYTKKAFEGQMQKLRVRETDCMSLGLRRAHGDSSCWRRFANVGHFESLVAVGTPSSNPSEDPTVTGWRYTPFITSMLGVVGNRELVTLPDEVPWNASEPDAVPPPPEPDFIYDWDISFSTVSPVKLALASDVSEMLSNADDLAGSGDWRNSLLRHPSAPKTRPVLRFLLSVTTSLLSLSVTALNIFYWYTRTLTTGIAMPSQLIDIAFDVVWAIVFVVQTEFLNFFQWLTLGKQLGLACLMGSLGARLEWSWWAGWVPVGVARRRPTRRERKSARVDLGGFGWRARGVFFLTTFLSYNLLSPPPLISSPATTPLPFFHRSNLFTSPFHPYILIESLFAPLWLSLFVPQLLLNHRSKTFAGSHRLAAILQFAEEVLKLVPRVLASGVFGGGEKWEGMDEVRIYDLIGGVVFGTIAWQATRYPAVRQEEEEEE